MAQDSLPPAPDSSAGMQRVPQRGLTWVCGTVATLLGALYAWDVRNAMDSDGISYLDMADAYLRRDWATAVNAYWSPLYSWFLAGALAFHPPARWEAAAVHLVNFLIYLVALACFHYFWTAWLGRDPVWMVFGTAVFLWSSLRLIGVALVTPDQLVAALVYLALGLLWRARQQESLARYALAGGVLGLGYLAKAVMFPLAFVFCGLALLLRCGIRKTAVMFLCFLLVSAPLIVALSRAKGRLTFSEAGRVTYIWDVAEPRVSVSPTGQRMAGPDQAVHPKQILHNAPVVVHERDYAFRATCPGWYDPSYWYEGAQLHFHWAAQLRQFKVAYVTYANLFSSDGGLLAGLLVLWLAGCAWRRPERLDWFVLLWSLAALAMYALVHVEPRLVAPFMVLPWLCAYRGFSGAAESKSRAILLVVAIALIVPLLGLAPQMGFRAVRDISTRQMASTDWPIAAALEQMGLRPGDRVAVIGDACSSYFIRLARLTAPTEIPADEAEQFWELDAAGKREVLSALARAGARAILAEDVPLADRPNWRRLANSSFYARLLPAGL